MSNVLSKKLEHTHEKISWEKEDKNLPFETPSYVNSVGLRLSEVIREAHKGSQSTEP